MQIREMNFKELDVVYELIKQLRSELSFKEFDDLVYDMRHMEYKMIGLFEKGELVTYAGVAVQTNFYYKRHLYVYDLVTDYLFRSKGYAREMLEYLEVYARTAMCQNIVLCVDSQHHKLENLYEKTGFKQKSTLLLKSL